MEAAAAGGGGRRRRREAAAAVETVAVAEAPLSAFFISLARADKTIAR